METRTLGKTGLQVTPFCLGTMMFGSMGNTDHDECIKIIHRAMDAGINFIDTADFYSQGESEEIVGKAIKGKRDELVIATKFFFPMDPNDPNTGGGSRKWIVKEVEDSLKRVGTDYIDLYQIHRYDSNTDMEEILFTLTELVKQGKIRYFGSSMFPADRIVESHWVAERRGLMKFRCEQPVYSIFAREIERFVLPACNRYGMGAITWSPLDGGFLTGRYRSSKDITEDTRVGRFAIYTEGKLDPEAEIFKTKIAMVEQLLPLAEQAELSMAQLAIAFVLEHPFVTSSIIGPRTLEQLENVLPAAEVRLDSAILDEIDKIMPPGSTISSPGDMPDGTVSRRRS
ncbi:MAG: aldo/keto reductase [Gammaproteobacteria bacterium]